MLLYTLYQSYEKETKSCRVSSCFLFTHLEKSVRVFYPIIWRAQYDGLVEFPIINYI